MVSTVQVTSAYGWRFLFKFTSLVTDIPEGTMSGTSPVSKIVKNDKKSPLRS